MRYKITIEYDGTSLLGWQEQLDGPSVQDYLQKALNCFTPVNDTDTCSLNNKEKSEEDFPIQELYEEAGTGRRLQKTDKIIVSGAGRTDAGVHATAQVAHFDLKEDLVDWKLREAINARLREMEAPVSVIAVEKVGNDFHARFSARGRGYLYRILNRRAPAVLEKNRVWWVPVPLDVEKCVREPVILSGTMISVLSAPRHARPNPRLKRWTDWILRSEEKKFISLSKPALSCTTKCVIWLAR